MDVRLAFVIALGAAVAFACNAYDESSPEETTPTTDGGIDASDAGADTGPAPLTWLPPEGAYRYRVTGLQRLSVGTPEFRDEGPIAPAQIRRDADPGCWRFRLCLVSGTCDDSPGGPYSEIEWSFCAANGRLEERRTRETTRWVVLNDLKLGVSTVNCEPGAAVYASSDFSIASFAHLCQGSVGGLAFTSGGQYRYVGEDSVQVGGTNVRAFHYTQERSVAPNAAGAPSGSHTGEWWLAANGLPLRVRRGARIDTNVGFGIVEFRQTSTTPVDAGEASMDDCVLDALEPTPLPVIDAGADGG